MIIAACLVPDDLALMMEAIMTIWTTDCLI